MNETLKSILEKGEELRFATKADDFKIMDKTNKVPQLTKLVISLCVTATFIIWYVTRTAQNPGMEIKWGVVAVFAAFGIFFAVSDIISSKKVSALEYYLTNKRIIVTSDPEKSLPLKDIHKYEFKMDADGHTSLLLGKAEKAPAKKWRMMVLSPIDVDDNTGSIIKYAIYAIKDADRFEKEFRSAMAEQ